MATPDLNRRAFLRGRSPIFNKLAIRPPWAHSSEEFIERCVRCDDCIQACPENIIVKGDAGFPEINFSKGECTFCGECVTSCKEGAFFSEQRTKSNAWTLQIEISPSCLSINKVTCRSCGDECEAGAIRFQLEVGGIARPIVQADKCTACGACMYICPNQSIDIKNTEQA